MPADAVKEPARWVGAPIRSYGQRPGERHSSLSCQCGVIIVCDYIKVPSVLRADRKLGMQRKAYTSLSNPFRPHILNTS